MAVDPRTRSPGDRGPGHLGRGTEDRRRARDQPGRGRRQHPPRHRPHLRLPGAGVLPGLPAADGRPRPRHRAGHLLPVPPQPRQPPPPDRRTGASRTVQAPELRLDRSRESSFTSASSVPDAPRCSPPSSPPPTPTPSPTGTPNSPRSTPASTRSERPRIRSCLNWSNCPPTPTTPAPTRCAPVPRPVQRAARRTRTPRSHSARLGTGHPPGPGPHPLGRAAPARGHLPRLPAREKAGLFRDLRRRHLVEQTR